MMIKICIVRRKAISENTPININNSYQCSTTATMIDLSRVGSDSLHSKLTSNAQSSNLDSVRFISISQARKREMLQFR